jgi:ER degradation enhancer, mannosidase alpha-like 2
MSRDMQRQCPLSVFASLLLPLLLGCARADVAKPPAPPKDDPALATRVRAELLHAWSGYKRYAWGHDELNPISKTPHDWYGSALLMTPVDSLDTLVLVGLESEADEAREYIDLHLDFDQDISVKNFEITIRLLGGLLSSYQLTKDPRLFALADDLGRRLLPVFGSPTGMPYVNVNLKTGATSGVETNPAEIGTLLLEFGTLAKLTKKDVYYQKAKRAVVALYDRRSKLGLVGDAINVDTGEWVGKTSSIGGGIDSYLEYLLKAWLLFGDEDCHRMWKESVAAVNRYVADETPSQLWYGQANMETGARTGTDFGALEAFFPAVLALDGDLDRARRLEDSAFAMWTKSGLEPDRFDYRTMRPDEDEGYPLRPEIIESAYYLHALTGDPRYIEMGRRLFEDIVASCRTEAGYAGLKSVVTREKADRMHSFFLAESLKYFYLLFSPPSVVDLHQVVFNTEAHPLRRTW